MQNLETVAGNVNAKEVVDYVKSSYPMMLSMALNILVMLVILFIGRKLIGVMMAVVKKSLNRMNLEEGIKTFFLSVLHTGSYVILVFVLADRLGVNSASILAMLGSAGLAIGLALQGSLSNLAGGVLILFIKPFVVGDYIVSPLAEGVVREIGMIYTTLITADNKKITIPNGSLSNGVITNVTAMHERRMDILISIANSQEIDRAKEIMRSIVEACDYVHKDYPAEYFIERITETSIVLCARVWCATSDYLNMKWELTEKMKKALDAEGIEHPFTGVLLPNQNIS